MCTYMFCLHCIVYIPHYDTAVSTDPKGFKLVKSMANISLFELKDAYVNNNNNNNIAKISLILLAS